MKFVSVASVFALAGLVSAAPQVTNAGVPLIQEKVVMSERMQEGRRLKEQDWQALDFSDVHSNPKLNAAVSACVNGLAAGLYPCRNINLHGFLSHQTLFDYRGNDLWGWTSPGGREIALVGQGGGTSFVEVLADGSLFNLGHLPPQTANSTWRGIKVIDHYAYIGSEATSHGLQVFDLNKVLNNTRPVIYTRADLTAVFTGFGSSHNIVANEATKTIYVVGANTCSGGLVAIDVSVPSRPVSKGCFSGDGYTHDSQCVVYSGPDTRYKGRPLCFNYNEDTLTITDHSGGDNAVTVISRTGYTNARYTHQGWFTDANQDFIIMDDELDETSGTGGTNGRATSYIWNVTTLTRPVLYDRYIHPSVSIDHNLYPKDGYTYHANYASGLRVTDTRNIKAGTGRMSEVAYFDTYPTAQTATFVGAWHAYPFFKSGYIVINDISNGVFSVKRTDI